MADLRRSGMMLLKLAHTRERERDTDGVTMYRVLAFKAPELNVKVIFGPKPNQASLPNKLSGTNRADKRIKQQFRFWPISSLSTKSRENPVE